MTALAHYLALCAAGLAVAAALVAGGAVLAVVVAAAVLAEVVLALPRRAWRTRCPRT